MTSKQRKGAELGAATGETPLRMKTLLAAAALCLLSCSSTTVNATPWGTVAGIPFAPVDAFFVPGVSNGDYNFVVIAVDQLGYCSVLQNNVNGYLANMNYATFTYSNYVDAGTVDPTPGTYPVTAAPGPSASAQASFGSISNCNIGPTLAGTSGNAVLTAVALDDSQINGSVNVGFADAGSLAGQFLAPLCDLSQSFNGSSACFKN